MGKKKGTPAAAGTDDYSRPGQGLTLGAFFDDGLTAQLGIKPTRQSGAAIQDLHVVPAAVARLGLSVPPPSPVPARFPVTLHYIANWRIMKRAMVWLSMGP